MSTVRVLAAISLLAVVPSPVQAACNGAGCSCSAATTNVSFGNYDPTSPSDLDSSGTVTVSCSMLAAAVGSFTVDLSPGTSGSYTQRTLNNGPSALNYNLFVDPARSQIWGNGTGSTQHQSYSWLVSVLNVSQNFTVYGRVFGAQNVPAATYSDTIIVTVNY